MTFTEDRITKKAVVLLSGGIDSSTTLAIAKSEGFELYAISFDYNQSHRRELDSARMVASSLGVKRHLIISFDMREIGGSALTSKIKVPKNRKSLDIIPVTYVPARNTIFLSFALGWAEVIEVEDIFIGANEVDFSGYPDCRQEYIEAFEKLANLATKASVEGRIKFRINAPLISFKKSDIIKRGIELGLDYSLTWSCYDPQPQKVQISSRTLPPQEDSTLIPCSKCDSCIIREKGFKEAGIRDPLIKST